MAFCYAESVTDVWQRLEKIKPYVKSRDIELLLEYREQHELYREELIQCKEETRLIKLILQTMNPGFATESSLQDLVQLSLPSAASSDMANKIYHLAVINKILTLAVKDGLDKAKNGTKIPIPRDSNSTPSFYNIIKEVKKENFDVEKDLLRATKLWLWVKKQCETSATEQSTPRESTETKPSIPKTQSLTALGSILPTPATSKPPHHSNSGGVTKSLGYQCHLLLNRHPASSKISSPEYKKLIALEDKLKYILDDLDCLQRIAPQTRNDVTKLPQQETVALQTELEDAGLKRSAKRRERSIQTSPEPLDNVQSTIASSKPLDQLPSDDVLGPNGGSESTQMTEFCVSCKKCYSKHFGSENLGGSFNKPLMEYDECQNSFNSTVTTGKHLTERQFSLASQLSTKDLVEDHNGNMCTVDRGVSARSTGFTPAKRRTVMTKIAGTQTVQFVDPEQASQDELLGDDVPDENGIRSYSDYRPNQSTDHESFSRSVASPDSETNIIWSVASKLKPGQWKELFKKLMQKSDEMIVPQEIKEDICTIMEEHQGDKMQAVESLELWRQTNGSFPIDVLLDALTDIRRKDIVNAVRKQISRLNQLH